MTINNRVDIPWVDGNGYQAVRCGVCKEDRILMGIGMDGNGKMHESWTACDCVRKEQQKAAAVEKGKRDARLGL